jgi:hypothetical protein
MKSQKANFHTALVLIERQLWKAGSAISLFNAVMKYGANHRSKNMVSPFLHATQAAAWTTVIVKCYMLVGDSRSLTIPKLIDKLAAEIEPSTGHPFLLPNVRIKLMLKVTELKPLLRHIKDLRNNEEGHTADHLSMYRIWDQKPEAEKDIELLYNGCVDIMRGIHKERGGRLNLPDFEAEISDDFENLRRDI